MSRTRAIALLAVPVCLGGLYWLMLHGYLELTAYLLAAAVLGMLVAAGWEWRRGNPRWAATLLVGALLTGGVIGSYGWNLNKKLDNIARINDGALDKGQRPGSDGSKALNILLLGSDNPDPNDPKPTVAELLADGDWDPGAYRSDSIMLVHIPASRKRAFVVSIPRDSFVKIYDDEGTLDGKNKINAAFSDYGPFGTWRTVENLSNLRLNHMAIIDFEGFKDLTTAIGGVDVYVPEEVYDEKQDQTWPQGWNHLEGDLALKYVRQRHGLTNGDFDRVARQQNFLRAVMEKTLADDTIGNPVKLNKTLDAITNHLTVDESWSNGEMRNLIVSLRDLDSDHVRFVTVPLDHYESVEGYGDVNIISYAKTRELFEAVGNDDMDAFLTKNPDVLLGDPKDVS